MKTSIVLSLVSNCFLTIGSVSAITDTISDNDQKKAKASLELGYENECKRNVISFLVKC